ncbi:MAG: DUF1559 domain-containing protein [Thermoguttaceae bacterium]|nr:DUF1559 domain-containing protein [Thermoguttaceae bacterium]
MKRIKAIIVSDNKSFRTNACRNAFTLVELLVVIAIMGILVALLLPAVNAARESGRQTTCRNNFHQLSMACLSYQNTYKLLPPACNFTNNAEGKLTESNQRANWIILILPFIGQENLFNEINGMLKQSGVNVENNTVKSKFDDNVTMKSCRETEIPSLLCPSDGNNRTKYESYTGEGGFTGARCNYGANMGPWGAQELYKYWSDNLKHGVMGPGKTMKTDEIRDGASNTIMLAELRSGIIAIDCRGTWALGGAGPSAIACCGYNGDSKGPNAKGNNADDIIGCTQVQGQIDSNELLLKGMACYNSANNSQATSRSCHAGGVFTAFCDGSVHWITDNISVGTDANHLGTWDKLLLPCDGFSLDSADF